MSCHTDDTGVGVAGEQKKKYSSIKSIKKKEKKRRVRNLECSLISLTETSLTGVLMAPIKGKTLKVKMEAAYFEWNCRD